MNKLKYIILLMFLITGLRSDALMIVQPESQEVNIKGSSIYFCGCANENEKVYINGTQVKPESNGAFAVTVPLKEGENLIPVGRLLMFEDLEIYKYKVNSETRSQKGGKQKFSVLPKSYYHSNSDNTILRSTPVDAGANRLGYLPQGTKLFVDAEEDGFMRVYLEPDRYGWVMKGSLTKSDGCEYSPETLVSENETDTETEKIYKITLSDNCPYSAEYKDNKLILNIFNLKDKYVKEFPLETNPRYSVMMKDKTLTVNIKKTVTSKSDSVIVIDAGHGGNERGAIGCLGDKEKNLNLEVAQKLKTLLGENGYKVVMTRDSDNFVSLNERVKVAKSNGGVFFVSIHLNSVPLWQNPNNHTGTTVYYYNPQSERFAQALSKSISSGLKVKNNGVVQSSLAVIRPTEYIGVLVEPLFLVNPKDSTIYHKDDFAQNLANSLYDGIKEYLKDME